MSLLKSPRNKVYSWVGGLGWARAVSHLAQAVLAASIVFLCLALVAVAILVKLAIALLDDLLSEVLHYAPRAPRG